MLSGAYFETDQIANRVARMPESYRKELAYGTGTNQATVIYAERWTTAGTLEMRPLVDVNGDSRTLAKVSFIAILNRDLANSMDCTGDFLQRMTSVDGATGNHFLKPGGMWAFGSPVSGSKYAVSAGFDTIAFDGTSTSFDVLIVGEE